MKVAVSNPDPIEQDTLRLGGDCTHGRDGAISAGVVQDTLWLGLIDSEPCNICPQALLDLANQFLDPFHLIHGTRTVHVGYISTVTVMWVMVHLDGSKRYCLLRIHMVVSGSMSMRGFMFWAWSVGHGEATDVWFGAVWKRVMLVRVSTGRGERGCELRYVIS